MTVTNFDLSPLLSALVPNFAKSLSRTFTGDCPGSLMIVVVEDDFVTKFPGSGVKYDFQNRLFERLYYLNK